MNNLYGIKIATQPLSTNIYFTITINSKKLSDDVINFFNYEGCNTIYGIIKNNGGYDILYIENYNGIINHGIWYKHYSYQNRNIKILLRDYKYMLLRNLNKLNVTKKSNNRIYDRCTNLSIDIDNKKVFMKDLSNYKYNYLDSIRILTLNEETKEETDDRDLDDLNDKDKICSICLTNKLSMVSVPCGHRYCELCINVIDSCAICRNNIEYRIKYY